MTRAPSSSKTIARWCRCSNREEPPASIGGNAEQHVKVTRSAPCAHLDRRKEPAVQRHLDSVRRSVGHEQARVELLRGERQPQKVLRRPYGQRSKSLVVRAEPCQIAAIPPTPQTPPAVAAAPRRSHPRQPPARAGRSPTRGVPGALRLDQPDQLLGRRAAARPSLTGEDRRVIRPTRRTSISRLAPLRKRRKPLNDLPTAHNPQPSHPPTQPPTPRTKPPSPRSSSDARITRRKSQTHLLHLLHDRSPPNIGSERENSGRTTTTDTCSKHNPGKSQGRPLKSPGSQPIVQNGLPDAFSQEGPCPGSPDRTLGAGRSLQSKDFHATTELEKPGASR
jgi:hypothetical protein